MSKTIIKEIAWKIVLFEDVEIDRGQVLFRYPRSNFGLPGETIPFSPLETSSHVNPDA
jgi:hypothetical protein